MRPRRPLAACLLLIGLAGCAAQDAANTRRGRGDAPVGNIDTDAKDVIQFPDRFSSVSHACDGHGHRVFVTTQSESGRFLWVVSDASCGSDRP